MNDHSFFYCRVQVFYSIRVGQPKSAVSIRQEPLQAPLSNKEVSATLHQPLFDEYANGGAWGECQALGLSWQSDGLQSFLAQVSLIG